MCGLGGVIGERDGIDFPMLRASLAHRGPDSEGEASPHPGVWLCASRLALRDPSDRGAQPMSSGPRIVVYNGELYNTRELSRALGDEAPPRSGDTALLLAAHRRWGTAMLERLEGMYAFALWDGEALLLARDPVGIKPLWLARGPGNRVVFASEVRSLVHARAITARLDPAGVEALLATGSASEPGGLLRGVEALPPGTFEVLRPFSSTVRRERFWSLPRPGHGDVEAIAARLATCVPASLAADSEVGLLLSDGVDSAAIALLAGSGVRRSFHVCTNDRAADIAAARARSLGLEHTEVALSPPELDVAAQGWLATQDQPSIDGLNTWIVARAVRAAGCKAVLSGAGGDELFGGYAYYRHADRLAPFTSLRRWLRRPARTVADLHTRAQLAGASLGGWPAAKAIDIVASDAPVEVLLRRLFPRALRKRLHPGAPPLRAPSHHEIGAVGAANRDLTGYLVDTLLRDADVMGMAHGVELRVPLLDARLVSLVASLPASLRFDAEPKRVLLDAVPGLRERVVPGKRGFELPAERLLAGPFGAQLRALAHDRRLVERCGLEPRVTSALFETASRSRGSAFRALAVGSLLSWARRHGASI